MKNRNLSLGLALFAGLAFGLPAQAAGIRAYTDTDDTTTGSIEQGPPDGEQRVPPGYYRPTPPGSVANTPPQQTEPPGYRRGAPDGPPDGEQRVPPGYYRPLDR